jgi:hypothetical protein
MLEDFILHLIQGQTGQKDNPLEILIKTGIALLQMMMVLF